MHQTVRKAGAFLILTAATTVIAVIGRVAADADQPTLVETLTAISENQVLYAVGGLGRLVSGITPVVGAWLLLSTWIIRERFATPTVPILFIISGAFTAISGMSALMLTVIDPDVISTTTESLATVRWLTGKIGFSAAGVALIVAARYQWMVGKTLKKIAPVSLLLGISMFLIWVDVGTAVHGLIGGIFFMWLLAVGTMLATGRTERHLVKSSDRCPS